MDLRVKATTGSNSTPGLEALEVDSVVEFITTGGLRLGRRSAWLLEAPPKLFASGGQTQVTIDERKVQVNRQGAVQWQHLCKHAGTRVVTAGRSHRRIELIEALVAHELTVLGGRGVLNHSAIALRHGRWTLLGEQPGTLMRVDVDLQALVVAPFQPVWAISQAHVVYLASDERKPGVPTGDAPAVRRWAERIIGAARGGLRLATLEPRACTPAKQSWNHFLKAATRLKRASTTSSEPAS